MASSTSSRILASVVSADRPIYTSQQNRGFSTAACDPEVATEHPPPPVAQTQEIDGPTGSLFSSSRPDIGPDLIGSSAHIQRTFGPGSNAKAALATGGSALAAHASFDPDYHRAQSWIRHHAVGPAVLSPVLVMGLTQSLAEAAFPQAIGRAVHMKLHEPLIVGVPVTASITVETVTTEEGAGTPSCSKAAGEKGFDVVLNIQVTRVRDDAVIASGTQELWIPDYLRM